MVGLDGAAVGVGWGQGNSCGLEWWLDSVQLASGKKKKKKSRPSCTRKIVPNLSAQHLRA